MSRGGVHNALPRGVLSAALARVVGDTIGEDGLERYGETLTPVLDLWGQPEWAYLRTEFLACFHRGQAAVAGEFGIVALVNPTGSGRLFVVEKISGGPAAQINFTVALALEGTISATLGSVAMAVSRDTRARDRVTGADKVVGQVWAGSDAVGIAGELERFTPPNGANNWGNALVSVPIIVQPGWGVALQGNVVNTQFNCDMGYRERVALPGELD